jgi:hypothetical protein
MQDLVATWPKTRPFQSYLDELRKASESGQLINYRVSKLPKVGFLDWSGRPKRCYMIYAGLVRGYNEIVALDAYGEGEILDPITGNYWPAGNYIVRDPEWYPVPQIVKQSFVGWRYFQYEDRKACREGRISEYED